MEEFRFDILVPLDAISRHAHGSPRDESGHAAVARDVLLCEGTKEERGKREGSRTDSVWLAQ